MKKEHNCLTILYKEQPEIYLYKFISEENISILMNPICDYFYKNNLIFPSGLPIPYGSKINICPNILFNYLYNKLYKKDENLILFFDNFKQEINEQIKNFIIGDQSYNSYDLNYKIIQKIKHQYCCSFKYITFNYSENDFKLLIKYYNVPEEILSSPIDLIFLTIIENIC